MDGISRDDGGKSRIVDLHAGIYCLAVYCQSGGNAGQTAVNETAAEERK